MREREQPAAEHEIELTVDGTTRRLTVEARETLAETLRERCDALGVRIGCGEGHCGACTVDLDGATARSCAVLAVQADGAAVRTVESLARPQRAAAPAAAGVHRAARAAVRLLHRRDADERRGAAARAPARPDDAAIRAALSGNLCRCTGYQGILRAVRAARDAR